MQFPVAKLTTQDYIRAGLTAIIVALVFGIFHFQGNTTDIRMFSRSALVWMMERWNDAFFVGADYSHGWLIPIATTWLIWRKRRELAAAQKSISGWGLAVVVFALLLHWLGAKSQQTRVSLMGLVLLSWGIPYYLYGRHVARLLLFPCSILLFCIPFNFLDSFTFPLRIFATKVSVGFLNGLGISVERSGSAIQSTAQGGFQLEVADPCSGIRSLIAMAAITAVYAHLSQPTLIKKWILFFASVPLAVIGNIARIIVIAILAEAFGQQIVQTVHDISNFIIFPVAVLCMFGLGSLMNLDFGKLREKWKRELLSPISS